MIDCNSENCANRFEFAKVIAKGKVGRFLEHRVKITCCIRAGLFRVQYSGWSKN